MRHTFHLLLLLSCLCLARPVVAQEPTLFYGLHANMTINEIQMILAQNDYAPSQYSSTGTYHYSSLKHTFRPISNIDKEFTVITVGACSFEVPPESSVTYIEFFAGTGWGNDAVVLDKLASIGIGDEYADIDGNIVFETETMRIFAKHRDTDIVVTFKQNDAQCKKLYDEAVARDEAERAEDERQYTEKKRQETLEKAREAQ